MLQRTPIGPRSPLLHATRALVPFGCSGVERIDAWVPAFLFSVLFGLSMDYQVFLLSRIRERYTHTLSTPTAWSTGLARPLG